jgi:UDP-perosamine 4-acetyltransferase
VRRRIVLVGAGPLGLNVAGILRGLPDFELVGFVDVVPGPVAGIPVLGDDGVLDDLWQEGIRELVVCIGHSATRTAKGAALGERGFGLPAIVHPGADLGVNVHLGLGSVIFPGVIILPESVVGDFAVIEAGAFVGHHTEVGRGALLGARSIVGHRVSLSVGVKVGMGAAVRNGHAVESGTHVADFTVLD